MQEQSDYETLPYSNSVFPQTYIDKLCSNARLFGVDAPDIETARVLELGCGNGLNLITQAYVLPNASFLGVDLAKTHIDYAKSSAQELGLSNIEFKQCDLMEMTVEEFGKFDYIIAHGLISWIPEFVREKTFAIYEEMLTENGIGYISYNTYPGCHYRQMVEGIAKIHTRNAENPREKFEKAKSFIKMLTENTSESVYKSIIADELNEYHSYHESVIFHDNLAEINEPYYFFEFAEKLNGHDLQFLAESQIFSMSIFNYPPEPKKLISSMEDIIWREQYIDFFTGRPFRQSLVCRNGIKLNHEPNFSILDKFYFAAPIKIVSETPEFNSEKTEKFVGLKDKQFETNHPLTKAALHILGEIWGDAILLEELFRKAQNFLEEREYSAENLHREIDIAKSNFLDITLNNDLIEIHNYKAKVLTELSNNPKINGLARWQLSKDNRITAAYGRILKLDNPILKEVLKLSDGKNTREDLHEYLEKFVESNMESEGRELLLAKLSEKSEERLIDFAKAGLFIR